jgi:hypothetical protein
MYGVEFSERFCVKEQANDFKNFLNSASSDLQSQNLPAFRSGADPAQCPVASLSALSTLSLGESPAVSVETFTPITFSPKSTWPEAGPAPSTLREHEILTQGVKLLETHAPQHYGNALKKSHEAGQRVAEKDPPMSSRNMEFIFREETGALDETAAFISKLTVEERLLYYTLLMGIDKFKFDNPDKPIKPDSRIQKYVDEGVPFDFNHALNITKDI